MSALTVSFYIYYLASKSFPKRGCNFIGEGSEGPAFGSEIVAAEPRPAHLCAVGSDRAHFF